MKQSNTLDPALVERELLKLNYTRKTLDALAGGDDTIFVILDDRDDVWLTESKHHRSGDEKPRLQPSDNLLKIPAYYYHEEPNLRPYTQAQWFEKEVRKVGQICDFDITLIIFLSHLKQIHS